ncbi:MAG: hypothetical protein JNM60_12625 [Candidatus Competibacteraceae bacterium]|nr:hypothetical protein [Candidatus Competibacteraceae bacterium]
MTESEKSFLDSLKPLMDAHSLGKSSVESTFGVTLHLDNSRSTPAYVFYLYEVSEGDKLFNTVRKIDFRSPANPLEGKHPFLYVELVENFNLNIDTIIAYYGQPQDLIPSTPQESIGTGVTVTYIYQIKDKKISFGVGIKGNITSVSFDH